MNKNKERKTRFNGLFSNLEPRTRAFIFFGVYLVFFAVIIAMLRTNDTPTEQLETDENQNINYQLNQIKNENYHYLFEINMDQRSISYEGDRYQKKEQFEVVNQDQKTEYFNSDGIFLVHKEKWELSSNPYEYPELLDYKEINRILKNSTYIAKTEYQNKEIMYQYQISTTSLVSLLKSEEIDIADEPNEIKVYVKDKEVYKIELNFAPYAKYLNLGTNTFNIKLEYSNFGNIKELVTPTYDV